MHVAPRELWYSRWESKPLLIISCPDYTRWSLRHRRIQMPEEGRNHVKYIVNIVRGRRRISREAVKADFEARDDA